MDRLMIVSADSHTGPPMIEYRPYVDPAYRDRFDDLLTEEAELLAGYRKLDRNAMASDGLEVGFSATRVSGAGRASVAPAAPATEKTRRSTLRG